jgi:hypothetical protein
VIVAAPVATVVTVPLTEASEAPPKLPLPLSTETPVFHWPAERSVRYSQRTHLQLPSLHQASEENWPDAGPPRSVSCGTPFFSKTWPLGIGRPTRTGCARRSQPDRSEGRTSCVVSGIGKVIVFPPPPPDASAWAVTIDVKRRPFGVIT